MSKENLYFDSFSVLMFQDDVVGKCKVRYEIKSRHLSRRPKVVYKMRNLTECTDRAKTDIGIHVHSYEEKVRAPLLISFPASPSPLCTSPFMTSVQFSCVFQRSSFCATIEIECEKIKSCQQSKTIVLWQ